MKLGGFELSCPHCHGDLEDRQVELGCVACERRYPVVAGIPDLRVAPDPYIDLEADRAKARALASRLDDFDFAGLVSFYYRNTPAVPARDARLYARGLLAAVPRARSFLETVKLGEPREDGPPGLVLDLGCGTAPLTVAAMELGHRLLGVDIALRWLVVARKRLQEHGLAAPLVCACAEALPFPARVFESVAGESVLDQVSDQRATLDECHRVLRPGGRLLLSTPNRLSLGPDPQTGIWAGSWLPERWVAALVRRRGGIPPRRQLLTARRLRHLLAARGFTGLRLTTPDVPAAQRRSLPPLSRAVVGAYRLARALPGSRGLLSLIGPLLLVGARKPIDSGEPR